MLDPDSNRAEWRGLESYHSWQDIENQIKLYLDELQSRLTFFNDSMLLEDEWRSQLWSENKAITLVIEEATTYGSFINKELLNRFGLLALTKSRKQQMPILIISHNNTQSCLFGITGLYNLVSKMLQVECLAEVNKNTLKPTSTGKAKVKLDSSNYWLEVDLPKLDEKIINFGVLKTPEITKPSETELENNETLISKFLEEPLLTIWKFCLKKQDWVSVRDISRKDFAVLKTQNSEQIKQHLSTLASRGYGEIELSGSTVRFKVYGVEPNKIVPDTNETDTPDT